MDLAPHVDRLCERLRVLAEATADEDGRVSIERLLPSLEPAVTMVLLEAIGTAMREVSERLTAESVSVRLNGTEPEFIVSRTLRRDVGDPWSAPDAQPPTGSETARTTVRLPEPLRRRIAEEASREVVSVNSWIVRALDAVMATVDSPHTDHRRAARAAAEHPKWSERPGPQV